MKTKSEISALMGARLKQLRENRNLSHDKLSNTITEQYKQYGISISRDSLINYEKPNGKNLGMRAECLFCLANFYGVSTDYLLGLSDIRTPEITAQAAVSYTGLSEDNVEKPYTVKQLTDGIKSFRYGITKQVNGNIPFLDCANDLLDALNTDQEIVTKYFMLRMLSLCATDYDSNFFDEDIEETLYEHGHTTMPAKEVATYACAELVKHIEWYLRKKYIEQVAANKSTFREDE